MSQINSLDYPGTNDINLNEGYFEIVDQNILPDRDDMFRSGFNSDLWNVTKTSNITTSYNSTRGMMEAEYDASSNNAELLVTSDYTLPSSNSYFCFDIGAVPYIHTQTSSGDKPFFVRIVDKGNSANNQLEIRIVSESSTNKKAKLEIEDLGAGTVIYQELDFGDTVDQDSNYTVKDVDFKVIFSPNGMLYIFSDGTATNITKLVEDSSIDLNGYTDLKFEFGLYISSGKKFVAETFFKSFEMFPVIDTLVADTDLPVPIPQQKEDGRCQFYFEPSYIANHSNITTYGCGTKTGSTDTLDRDVQVLDTYDEEDSKKFLVSKVENYHTDDTGQYVCRNVAKEVDVSGDLNVNMECFCDGSNEDSSAKHLALQTTANLEKSYDKILDNPKFKMLDSQGDIGYGFDFSRHIIGDDSLKASSDIKFLNSMVYDENTVIYYGPTYTPVRNDQQIDIQYEVSPYQTSISWELYNVDADEQVTTGSTSSDTTNTHTLDRGRYRVHIPASSDSSCIVTIYFGDKTNGNKILKVDTGKHFGGNQPGDIDIFFEVKQFQSDGLVVYVHDICNNDVSKYEQTKNISLRTDSLGCAKNEDGDLVFLYQQMPDKDVYSNIQDNFNYDLFDMGSKSWGTGGTVEWPLTSTYGSPRNRIDKYIHSFDLVSSDDNYYFVFSMMQDVQKPKDGVVVGDGPKKGSNEIGFYDLDTNNSVSAYPGIAPVIDQNTVLYKKKKRDSFVRDHFEELKQDEENVLPNQSLRLLKRKSFDQIISDSSGNSYKVGYTGHSFFDCTYDRERDKVLISALSNYRRLPFVYEIDDEATGVKSNIVKELYMPWHFNTGAFMKEHEFGKKYDSNLSYDNRENVIFSLRSLSACYSNDGFVYTVATRRDCNNVGGDFSTVDAEIGLLEPSLEDSNDQYRFIQLKQGDKDGAAKEKETEKGLDREFYRPNFKFQAVPFGSLYHEGGISGEDFDVGVRHMSINSHYQYMMATCGGDNFTLPYIMMNGEYSELPFEVVDEERFYPENAFDADTYIDGFSLGGGVTDQDHYLNIPNDSNFYKVKRDLSSTYMPEDKLSDDNGYVVTRGERGQLGFNFHARLQEDFAGGSSFSRDLIFEAKTLFSQYVNNVQTGISPYDNTAYVSKARFKGDGNTYKCQIYNGKDSAWETCDTVDLSGDSEKIKDFYILIKQVDFDANLERGKFKVLFIVKKRPYVREGFNNNNYEYDIRSVVYDGFPSYAESHSETLINPNSLPPSKTWIGFEDDGTTTDTSENARFFELGWNVLKGRDFFQYSSPLSGTTKWNQEIKPGTNSFRRFNDGILFEEYESPSYFFRTQELEESRTCNFHWHNGFKYNFSGESGHIGDEYSLERKLLSGVDTLVSKKLYGLWNSNDDNSNVKVWAEAKDSDLKRFYNDMVVVDGVNVPKLDIIGGEEGSWGVIDTIDLRRLYFPASKISYTHKSSDDEYVVEVTDADFDFNDPRDFEYYYYDENSKKITKVDYFEDNKIHLKYNQDPSYSGSEGAYIFSSRGVKILDVDRKQREKAFGFEFKPNWDTYEGNFRAKTLDFGIGQLIPVDYMHDAETGKVEEIESDVNYLNQEQAFSNKKFNAQNFELTYSLLNPVTYMKIKSIISSVGVNKYPLWLVESYEGSKDNVYLSLIDGEPSSKVLIDDDGDKNYELDINFKVLK